MASKTIKGLTVEIGGDTTKLGKALDEVNKKSVDLSGELRDINKLLKLDPGNTDALAQKQKLLAESIDNTKKKLNTLKEAERQVQEQFERGEVSEEQVRALQREIIATTAKLKKEEQQAAATAADIAKYGNKSDAAADDTEEAGKEAKSTSKKLDDLADSADKAGKSGEGMGGKLAGAAKAGIAAVGAAAVGAVGGFLSLAESTREYRTGLNQLTAAYEQVGISQEETYEAFNYFGSVLGDTRKAQETMLLLSQITDSQKGLTEWTDTLTGVYAVYGEALPLEGLTEAVNHTSMLGEVQGTLADALEWGGITVEDFNANLAALNSKEERAAYIQETLNGLYGEAAKTYNELNKDILDANTAATDLENSLAELGAIVEPIMTKLKFLAADFLSEMKPSVELIGEGLTGALEGADGAADKLADGLSSLINSILDKIVGAAPMVVQTGVSLITSLTTTLISMLPQLLTVGVQLVMTIIDGLVSAIPQLTQALVDMIPQLTQALVSGIPQLIQGAVSLFLTILDAIPQILPPLVEALPQIVLAIIDGLLTAIPQLIEGALTFLLAIVDAIPLLIDALLPQIPVIVQTLIDGLLDNYALMFDAAIRLFFALVEAVPKICLQLLKELPQIWLTINKVLISLPSRMWGILKQVIAKWTQLDGELKAKASRAAQNALNAVIDWLKTLPSKVWSAIKGAIDNVAEWGTKLVAKGRQAAKDLVSTIVDGVKSLPSKMKSIGSDLVKGLWNGINDMKNWVINKIKGFSDSVLNGIKDFFGVHSPSTKTTWLGKMLDQGLVVGIEEDADAPVAAMSRLADDLLDQESALNGLTIDRQLNATFGQADAAQAASSGLMSKLDRILEAIEKGQVLTIDGDTLVGSTLNKYDSKLGQRRDLAARGAL